MPNGEFDLAFIDYRFGPSLQRESVERAVRWATHLYKKGRTFIILMSSAPDAYTNQDKFRNDSKLTRGLFEFVDKKEITDRGKFCNRLNSFCAGLDTRHEIHQFASAAETAIGEAMSALKESIHALGLEDYAYLEQISLREDGHPLGDYMLWLFGEYVGHKLAVNASLQPARELVNGIKYERFLPLQRPPSVMLAKMYSAAITEPVHEGWNPHPREAQETVESPVSSELTVVEPAVTAEQPAISVEAPAGPDAASLTADVAILANTSPPFEDETEACTGPPSVASPAPVHAPPQVGQALSEEVRPSLKGLPLYQLGDLLVADKNRSVFLILNAGCDLQFSPGKRDCDPQQTILLVPGRFEPLHERGEETKLRERGEEEKNVKRTELFELGDERFRIIWQHTRAVALPYYKIRAEHEPKGYERKWRLKLPYALEIQQHFAAQLTRVGVPTPTPMFRERPVQVYAKDAKGMYLKVGDIDEGVVVFHHREQDQFILTVDCVHAVLDIMSQFVTASTAELEVPPADASASPDERLAKQGERRKKYLQNVRDLREILSYRCQFQDTLTKVPALSSKVTQLDGNNRAELEVYHVVALEGRYESGAPIVLAFFVADNTEVTLAGTAASAEVPAPPEESTENIAP